MVTLIIYPKTGEETLFLTSITYKENHFFNTQTLSAVTKTRHKTQLNLGPVL